MAKKISDITRTLCRKSMPTAKKWFLKTSPKLLKKRFSPDADLKKTRKVISKDLSCVQTPPSL